MSKEGLLTAGAAGVQLVRVTLGMGTIAMSVGYTIVFVSGVLCALISHGHGLAMLRGTVIVTIPVCTRQGPAKSSQTIKYLEVPQKVPGLPW